MMLLSGCNEPGPQYTISTAVNPNKIAPLSAIVTIESEAPFKVSFKIPGEHPIEKSFTEKTTHFDMPVLGLYPGIINEVRITITFDKHTITETVPIETDPIPSFFPEIVINKIDRSKMADGLHGCDMHYANFGKFHSIPMIFDDQGKVRWYLDLSFNGKMTGPFQRLTDGTLLMVDRHAIFEYDMLGKLHQQTLISPIYGMHHEVLELPNGNLLICVGKRDQYINIDGEQIRSDNDFIIYYDRKESKIGKEWDLAKHLDVSRNDLNFLRKGDWLHMNGLAFDAKDSTLIVSGRNQGLSKISWNDKLKWIKAPKQNWKKSGRTSMGKDTKPFLLTALDSEGLNYPEAVQLGIESAVDFDFTWGTHAPILLPNGNLMAFDNGFYRNFGKGNAFSRAVEYSIDEPNRTVKQVWQYGKERGIEFYSAIASDVDYLPEKNNVLVTSGFIGRSADHKSKIVEVDYETGNEVFEATLHLKTVNGNKTRQWGQIDLLYRSERMNLY
jgi:arylsulfate sulfotransferase